MGAASGWAAHRVEAYAELAERMRAAPPRLGPVRLVAVDGPTGSGKSTFAGRLAGALETAGATGPVTVVQTDDLLAGWGDTVTFWPRLERWVLAPLRAGRDGAYRRYDWVGGGFGAERIPVPAAGVLVLDGVTTLRREVRAELTLGVWMDLPYERAVARAVARDGPAAEADLLAWHERERAHFAADRPWLAADLVVAGSPATRHNPDREYVVVTGR